MKQKLHQKQVLRFTLSPQMQQGIRILSLPLLELKQVVEEEIQTNPILEEINQEPSDKIDKFSKDKKQEISDSLNTPPEEDSFSNWEESEFNPDLKRSQQFHQSLITKSITLQESLLRQLRLTLSSDEKLKIGEAIIGYIDENGYLSVSLEEIAKTLNISEDKVNEVLSVIQGFEPIGLGARNLAECLLIQMRYQNKTNTLAYKMIETALDDVAKKRYEKLSKSFGVSPDEIKEEIAFITSLEPKPGRLFSRNEPVRPIIPDVALKIDEKNKYQIVINNEEVPRLRINPYYRQLLNRENSSPEVVQFIEAKLSNASLLIKNIQQRYETIRQVTNCIIEMQGEFFKDGMGRLKPLTYQDVAKKIGRHESTICRVVCDKYMETPWGVFPFKRFFSGKVKTNGNGNTAAQEVKERIQRLIDREDKQKPLSDQEIVEILFKENIKIARRTVTKYRQANKVLPSNLRKI